MEIDLALLADAATIDGSGKLNILGVFVSAPLFAVLAGGKDAAFHGDQLVKVMTMLLLPFVIG